MGKELKKIFKQIVDAPSEILAERIMQAIEKEKAKKLRQKLLLIRLAFSFSALLMSYLVYQFGATLVRSEFWTLSSLIFSDTKVLLDYWSEYLFSLLETFPVIQLIFLLIPLYLLLVLARGYAILSIKQSKLKLIN
jgi:hypothetical protein